MRFSLMITLWIFVGSLSSDPINALDLFKGNEQTREVFYSREYKDLKNRVIFANKNSWCSEEKTELLMDLVVLKEPKICVEVGVFMGASVLPVAATLKMQKSGKFYAIDAWSNEIAVKNMALDDPNRSWWSHVDMHYAYTTFLHMIHTWDLPTICHIIKDSSESAVSKIPDGIDFLHLDGDYSENGSLQDVEKYVSKVKSGGYILLSNFLLGVNGQQPKSASFEALNATCELVADVDNSNTILFKKN